MAALERRFTVEYVTSKEDNEFESPVNSPTHKRQKTHDAEVRKLPYMFTYDYRKRKNRSPSELRSLQASSKRQCLGNSLLHSRLPLGKQRTS